MKHLPLIIGVIVVVGIGTVVVSHLGNTPASESGDSNDVTAPAVAVEEHTGRGDERFTGTVTDLLKGGKNLKCTFSRTDDNATIEGEVFVANDGRLRGDFSMTQPQFGTINAHVIRDGEYNYTWGMPMMQGGLKTPIDDDGKPIKTDDKSGPDFDNEAMEYTCKTWRVDASKFALPDGVEFQDISAEVQKIKEATDDLQAMKCDACNQVPAGPGRDQCLAAMGC